MNVLKARLKACDFCGDLCELEFELGKDLPPFFVLMFDFKESLNLNIGDEAELLFKENELILFQNGLSLGVENSLELEISNLEEGEFFVQIFFKDELYASNLSALLSKKALKRLNLEKNLANSKIKAGIKASDVMVRVL